MCVRCQHTHEGFFAGLVINPAVQLFICMLGVLLLLHVSENAPFFAWEKRDLTWDMGNQNLERFIHIFR